MACPVLPKRPDSDAKVMIRPDLCCRNRMEANLQTVKVPLRVDGDDVVPFLLGHVEHHAVAEDAGDRHDDVELAEVVEGGLDDILAAFHSGYGVVAGDGISAGGLDLCDDLGGRALRLSRSIDVASEVVDDDLCALRGKLEGNAASDSSS